MNALDAFAANMSSVEFRRALHELLSYTLLCK
jgi:hypothetical protein